MSDQTTEEQFAQAQMEQEVMQNLQATYQGGWVEGYMWANPTANAADVQKAWEAFVMHAEAKQRQVESKATAVMNVDTEQPEQPEVLTGSDLGSRPESDEAVSFERLGDPEE